MPKRTRRAQLTEAEARAKIDRYNIEHVGKELSPWMVEMWVRIWTKSPGQWNYPHVIVAMPRQHPTY